jgi:hypothetical protein
LLGGDFDQDRKFLVPLIDGGEVVNHKSLEEISERMAGIDIAILSTHTEDGQIANRPMSNNGRREV